MAKKDISNDMFEWIDQIFADLKLDRLSPAEQKNYLTLLRSRYQEEKLNPPKIAVIGRTGVGKSSTINALFNKGLPISHTKASTLSPIQVNVKVAKGELILFDMPGLGEDLEKEEDYRAVYKEVLSQCDVALWVVSAADRSLSSDQYFIADIIKSAKRDWTSRLVIGVNKVDLIHPNNWNKRINLPSREQERNLIEIKENVRDKLSKVIPKLKDDQIIGYSALKRFSLLPLFRAMLDACPDDRAWVLSNLENMADYWALVDKDVRRQVQPVARGL
jgi:uncharacterized protein